MSSSSLAVNEILPMIGNKFCYYKSQAYRALETHSINGIGLVAAEVTSAIETLTMRDDLHFLTMLQYANVIGYKGLLRRERAWCPACLDELRESDREIYEPLAWALELYTICPDHGAPLASVCPYCGLGNPFKSRRFYPGYCSRCGCWLGGTGADVSDPGSGDNQLQLRIAYQIGRMIAEAPSLERKPDRMHFVRLVQMITSKISVSRLARDIGVSPSAVITWRGGKYLPRLEYLLRVCLRFNIDVVDLVTGKVSAEAIPIDETQERISFSLREKLSCKPFDYEKARMTLETAIWEGDPAISLTELAKRNCLYYGPLRKKFPKECLVINTRYLMTRAARKKERIAERCREVEIITQHLHKEGIYPSERAVIAQASRRNILTERDVYAAWQRAKSRLDIDN
jgi:transcriptional regulator with XRE-family HTH domain